MDSETWSNRSMPSSILPRKSAELVWLPVGAQGTLVAIGGSVNRDGYQYRMDLYNDYRVKGQSFVDNVHLYDIANDQWYVFSSTLIQHIRLFVKTHSLHAGILRRHLEKNSHQHQSSVLLLRHPRMGSLTRLATLLFSLFFFSFLALYGSLSDLSGQ